MGWLKNMLKSWLNIQEPQSRNFFLQGMLDFDATAIKNEIWYRGDPDELMQLYKQLGSSDGAFWSSVPSTNSVRKIHTGLPNLIVDILTDIVMQDMAEIESSKRQVEIEEIVKENDFKNLISNMLNDVLVKGDGAIKISFDKSISEAPLLEFYRGDRVEFIYQRGKYIETVFRNYHIIKNTKYVHLERYGFGYIKNEIVRLDNNRKVNKNDFDEFRNLQDFIFAGYSEDMQGNMLTKGMVNLAIPFKIFKSSKFKNRGKSIFDSKTGNFDALDEIVSQWLDAIRKGRATTYIPKSLMPRNPYTGEALLPNAFEHTYVETKGSISESDKEQIQVTQPVIPSENYLESYVT